MSRKPLGEQNRKTQLFRSHTNLPLVRKEDAGLTGLGFHLTVLMRLISRTEVRPRGDRLPEGICVPQREIWTCPSEPLMVWGRELVPFRETDSPVLGHLRGPIPSCGLLGGVTSKAPHRGKPGAGMEMTKTSPESKSNLLSQCSTVQCLWDPPSLFPFVFPKSSSEVKAPALSSSAVKQKN